MGFKRHNRQVDDETEIVYTWEVKTSKAWMNVMAPMMRRNHNQVMHQGAAGLAKYLNATVIEG